MPPRFVSIQAVKFSATGFLTRPSRRLDCSGPYDQQLHVRRPALADNPNSTQMDNYGTGGNVNPYTGAVGTRTPKY